MQLYTGRGFVTGMAAVAEELIALMSLDVMLLCAVHQNAKRQPFSFATPNPHPSPSPSPNPNPKPGASSTRMQRASPFSRSSAVPRAGRAPWTSTRSWRAGTLTLTLTTDH